MRRIDFEPLNDVRQELRTHIGQCANPYHFMSTKVADNRARPLPDLIEATFGCDEEVAPLQRKFCTSRRTIKELVPKDLLKLAHTSADRRLREAQLLGCEDETLFMRDGYEATHMAQSYLSGSGVGRFQL